MRRATRSLAQSPAGVGNQSMIPLSGGGSIALEAQRLGLRAIGSDLRLRTAAPMPTRSTAQEGTAPSQEGAWPKAA